MSEYNWCHGTNCHKSHTQDRVRGSKGSKILRTRKVKQQTNSEWYRPDQMYNYFCSQGCLFDFIRTHIQQIVSIDPRTEPLETPIEVKTETRQDYYGRDYEHKIVQELGVDTAD